MEVSEQELARIKQQATLRAAQAVRMDVELMTPEEITETLHLQFPELAQCLQAFLDGFQAWFDFHSRIEHEGREGKLSAAEKRELVDLVDRKEQARRELVAMTQFPGVEASRAWVYEVINPALEKLDIAKRRLEVRQWTWRYYQKRCELISPMSPYFNAFGGAKSVVLVKTRHLSKEHDERLEKLIARLQEAQERLEAPGPFADAVNKELGEHLKKYKDNQHASEPWGAAPKEKFVSLVAQFVINEIDDLQQGTSTMYPFWNERRAAIVGSVDINSVLQPIREAGEVLRSAVDALMIELDKLRNELCAAHQIPPFRPSTGTPASRERF